MINTHISQHTLALTDISISKLSADHVGVVNAPEVVTHCSPDLTHAHLHSAQRVTGTTHQPHISIHTGPRWEGERGGGGRGEGGRGGTVYETWSQ